MKNTDDDAPPPERGPTPEARAFGARIAAARELRNWEQADLATKLGCAPEHIRRIEKGGPISTLHRNKLDELFGSSLDGGAE